MLEIEELILKETPFLSIKDINYRKNSDEKITESVRGFSPLRQHLPIWIEEKITELRREEDTAD